MAGLIKTVASGLVAGFGAEDIAAREGIDVQTVRAAISHLRATGRMPMIISGRKLSAAADLSIVGVERTE